MTSKDMLTFDLALNAVYNAIPQFWIGCAIGQIVLILSLSCQRVGTRKDMV